MNPKAHVTSIASIYEPNYGLQLLLLAAFLIPATLFLLTQQNTLRRVKRANRLMHPGLVWLQLIPVFGNFWQFVVITKTAGSIRKELASRLEDPLFGVDAAIVEGGIPRRPTQGIGIAYCILDTAAILVSLINDVFQVLGDPRNNNWLLTLTGYGTIICWIIYWVQLARYKNKLKRIVA